MLFRSGVTLQDGRVWLGGGITHITIFGIPIPDFSSNVNLYDPATNSFSNGGNVGNARALFGSRLLADGRVAIIAGAGGDIFNIGPIRACPLLPGRTAGRGRGERKTGGRASGGGRLGAQPGGGGDERLRPGGGVRGDPGNVPVRPERAEPASKSGRRRLLPLRITARLL